MNATQTKQQTAQPDLLAREDKPIAISGESTLLAIIERTAKDPDADVEKMERMLAMYERVQAKNAEGEFTESLAKVQSQISRILPNKKNNQTNSKYATYPMLDKIIRPLYIDAGFSLSFDTGEAAGDVLNVLCHVSHKAGHTRTYHAPIPADGKGAKGGEVMTRTHATGSAMTYGMRYLLKLIFNLPIGEDDDGNGAAGGMDDSAVSDPIYDKISLAETLDELRKLKPEIEEAKVQPHTRRNLIASWNKRRREVSGA